MAGKRETCDNRGQQNTRGLAFKGRSRYAGPAKRPTLACESSPLRLRDALVTAKVGSDSESKRCIINTQS